MSRSSIERHARRLARLEKNVRDAATKPRLGYSSIDDGALEVRDPATGQTTAIIGQQFDGTTSSAAVGGTFPVAPTMPLVTPIVGGLRLYWDGTYVDGSPTRMDFRRVTFHAVTDIDLIDALDPAQIVGEITIATGGEITVGLPYIEHFIYTVVWTEAGKFSVESDIAFGTPLKSGPADQTSDGEAPVAGGAWTASLMPLGIMALQAEWPGVENVDAVMYDVHVSDTDGFTTFDDTTFAGTTAGSFMAIQSLPDGSPFLPDTTYYVRVLARDADGVSDPSVQGSSMVRQADSIAIAPSYVYTGGISANQVTAGDLSASIAVVGELITSGAGRQVSLSSADGLKATDLTTGVVLAHIPTDSTQDIALKADLVANSITALGPVAMRSALNEVGQAAVLLLRTGAAAPASPPPASITWHAKNVVSASDATWYHGGNFHTPTTKTYQAWGIWGFSGVKRYDSDGDYDGWNLPIGTGSSFSVNCYSAARYGNTLYVLTMLAGSYGIFRYDVTVDASPVLLAGWSLFPISQVQGHPAMTIDETTGGMIVVWADPSTGGVKRTNLNRDTGAVTSTTTTSFGITPGAPGLCDVYYGEADHVGTKRLYVTWEDPVNAGDIHCDGAPAYYFPAAFNQPPRMLTYNATLGCFVTLSSSTGDWHRYDGTMWTGAESPNWFATATWVDTDATGGLHETSQGPATTFTMKKRARVELSSAAIPTDPDTSNHNDPDSVKFYLGRVGGTSANQFLQATPAPGVVNATIIKAIFSNADTLHPNPPTLGNFPTTTPGILRSDSSDGDGPLFWADGAGGGRWKKYDDLNLVTQVAATADLAVTTTHTQPTGLTSTVTSPGATATWLVEVSLDAERLTTAGGQFLSATLVVDGTEVTSPQLILAIPGTGRFCITKQYVVTGLAAGSKVIKVNAWTNGGTDWKIYANHSAMTLRRLN